MSETTWGIRFNHHSSYERVKRGQMPSGCPDWLNLHQVDLWQEQGLVVWDNIEKKLEHLSGHETLVLLNQLTSQDDWKSAGVSITRLVHRINLQEPPRGKRKKADQEPATEPPQSKSETVCEEIIHLPPEAGPELIELLQTNKQHIAEIAECEKKRCDQALSEVYDLIFKYHRKDEMTRFDFKSRTFAWECTEENRRSCLYQQAKGSIWLDKSPFFWRADVQRPGFVGKYNRCVKLDEAVDWVEKELVDLASQPQPPEPEPLFHSREQREADHTRLLQKLIDSPYWIEPVAMEPEHITYRVIIVLDAKPIDFKTFESSCGEAFRYDERYPMPSKLSTALGLEFDHFNFSKPAGESSKWYLITSVTTYYLETSAAEQAQKVWDQSHIVQQFKARKIIRARYGYQEIETGFPTYLGGCENQEHPWETTSRQAYMADRALRESLCYALDVNDFHDYLGLSEKLSSDDELLSTMHETRAKSKCVPPEARQESRVWLAQHEPLDER